MVTNDVELGVEGLELWRFGFGVADFDQTFEQSVKAMGQTFAKAKFMVTGQAVQDGDVPLIRS